MTNLMQDSLAMFATQAQLQHRGCEMPGKGLPSRCSNSCGRDYNLQRFPVKWIQADTGTLSICILCKQDFTATHVAVLYTLFLSSFPLAYSHSSLLSSPLCMHLRWTRVMDSDPHINLTTCSPITVRVLCELLTVVERNFHNFESEDGCSQSTGYFFCLLRGICFRNCFSQSICSLCWLFPFCCLSKGKVSEGLSEFTTWKGDWASTGCLRWKGSMRKKGDKTSAAIAFIIGLWELVQPWVLLQGNSHMPWLHDIAG